MGEGMSSDDKVKWSPDMSVGVNALDEDHKILIACLNDFIDACENDEGLLFTDAIFSILLDYTGFHFAREEKIMEICGYDGLENHKLLHETLRDKVLKARDRFVFNRDGELETEIKIFLQSWLTEHILGRDMEYAKYCVGKEREIASFLENSAG